MKCLRCNEVLMDGVYNCPKCGFMFDTTRTDNILTKAEYQQLGVIDVFNILVQKNIILLRGTDNEITNANNMYLQAFQNCNMTIPATFIGVHKVDGFNNKIIRYRTEREAVGNDLIDKIKSLKKTENVTYSLYPIFRYEYNGAIYVSEGLHPLDANSNYTMGFDYNINIDPNMPNMMLYNKNVYNGTNDLVVLNDGLVTDKTILFVGIRLVVVFILFLLALGGLFGSIGSFITSSTTTKNYIETEATLAGDITCDKNLCSGEYGFYVKGIYYSVVVEGGKDELKDKINLMYSPSDPYSYVLSVEKKDGSIVSVLFSLILAGGMAFLGIFHLNLLKKDIRL